MTVTLYTLDKMLNLITYILQAWPILSLTHTKEDLKEPNNQGIKVQVTTKDIKKEDRVLMKSPTTEA